MTKIEKRFGGCVPARGIAHNWIKLARRACSPLCPFLCIFFPNCIPKLCFDFNFVIGKNIS